MATYGVLWRMTNLLAWPDDCGSQNRPATNSPLETVSALDQFA